MKVLVFGAGASKAAGYPLASELVGSIEREARSAGEVTLRDAWQRWEDFRRSVDGPLKTLLSSQNPEIVLSVPDLFAVALEAWDAETRRLAAEAFSRSSMDDAGTINQRWKSVEREALWSGVRARNRFVDCLHRYFAYRHHADGGSEGRERRQYLHRLLCNYAAGDAVITFNWDTTVERTLAEQQRWNPLNGYGFEKELLISYSSVDEPIAVPDEIRRHSEVVVLKLHGSFGWHAASGSDGMYFDRRYYLRGFGFECNKRPIWLVDPGQPTIGPPDTPVLSYPSFLKQLGSPEMQMVWSLADQALRMAASVDVWGYSLPASDSAARVLLNVLRPRLGEHRCAVRIHNPDEQARERWRQFLGAKASIDSERLE